MVASDTENPFLINAANHDLIGVANVFLDALFYDVKLDYYVAIINQQGEVRALIVCYVYVTYIMYQLLVHDSTASMMPFTWDFKYYHAFVPDIKYPPSFWCWTEIFAMAHSLCEHIDARQLFQY
mgnify:CR=1 FL=1